MKTQAEIGGWECRHSSFSAAHFFSSGVILLVVWIFLFHEKTQQNTMITVIAKPYEILLDDDNAQNLFSLFLQVFGQGVYTWPTQVSVSARQGLKQENVYNAVCSNALLGICFYRKFGPEAS